MRRDDGQWVEEDKVTVTALDERAEFLSGTWPTTLDVTLGWKHLGGE